MKRNAFRTRLAAALLLIPTLTALAALTPGCSERGKSDNAIEPVVPVLEPIPAPPGLLAAVTIPAPEATWKDTRLAVGGPALFLPQSIGGFMTTVLGLPITVAGEFDGSLAALGAIIDAPERGQPYAAIGVHVKVGERLVDQLTKGEAARFTARMDPTSGVTALEPKGTVKGPVAMGVLGNYLLIGRELADLTAAGPYIVRTLSKAPAGPKEDIVLDVPDAALAGPVKRSLERARAQLMGVKAQTVPLLPLERIAGKMLEIVPDLARARLSIDIDGPSVRLRLEGAPREGGGPASVALRGMTAGDVEPLRALPGGTLLGVLDRESGASRAASFASSTEMLLSGVGEKLAKADREAVEAVLRSISEARGDWLSGGVSFGSTGPLAYVQGAVSDDEKLGKALKDLWALSKRPSIKAWLKESGFAIKVGKAVVEDVPGDVQRVTIARVEASEKEDAKGAKAPPKGAKDAKAAKTTDTKDPKAAPEGEVPSSVDLFYAIRKDGVFATAGYGAKEGFSSFLGGDGAAKGRFGEVPEIKAAIDAIGGDVSFALVADPLRFIASRAGKPGSAPSAPVVVALGRSGGAPEELWIRLDVAVVAIQELVKHRGALSL